MKELGKAASIFLFCHVSTTVLAIIKGCGIQMILHRKTIWAVMESIPWHFQS